MSRLLEVLGTGLEVSVSEIIWDWLAKSKLNTQNIFMRQSVETVENVLEAMEHDEPERARMCLEIEQLRDPECPITNLAIAAFDIEAGDIHSAILHLNKAYRKHPNNVIILYALGHCCERTGNSNEAIQYYQDCLKFKKYMELPLKRLAALYLKAGQLEMAIDTYSSLVKEYPEKMELGVSLAFLYLAAGQHKDAANAFNTAILMISDSPEAADEEIEQMIAAGQYDQALDAINIAIAGSMTPCDLEARKGDIMAAMGETDASIKCYEAALRTKPDCLETLIKLGSQCLMSQKVERAAKAFSIALEQSEQIFEAYIGLSIVHEIAGKTRECENSLELATALAPNCILLFAQCMAVQMHLLASGPGLSQPVCETVIPTAIALHENSIRQYSNPDTHYRLAMLYLYLKNNEVAMIHLKAALEYNPTYHRARWKLAVATYNERKAAMARSILCEHLLPDRRTIDLHYATAILYCNKVRFASAVVDMQKTVPSNYGESIPGNLSVVLRNLGLQDKRSEMWENVADMLWELAAD